MSLSLEGWGTALPPHPIDQQTMAAAAEPCSCRDARQRKLLPALYRKTRVERRHSVLMKSSHDGDQATLHERMMAFYPPAQHEDDLGPPISSRMVRYAREAVPLAAEACHAALRDADLSTDAITQLVTVSCTGFSAPGIDIALIDALGLRPDIGRSMVGFMGCHGAMNGLRAADGLAQKNAPNSPDQAHDGRVLLCCVELCTLHFQYGWEPQRIVSNALFADGAAAVVGRHIPEAAEIPTAADHHASEIKRSSPPRVAARGSFLVPDTRDTMTWFIRDHGFEMTLSPRVPDLIIEHLHRWITPWLAGQNLSIGDIQGWAIHPGGPRIISAVEQALDLPQDAGHASRQVLRDMGNMSSPTVLFILNQLRLSETPRPWVGIAFGPGLTIEAVLIR